MATAEQIEFLKREYASAQMASHIWPAMAACEAALETGWGASQLYQRGNNVFGEKQHDPPVFLTVTLPTLEFNAGQFVKVTAQFIWFPTSIDAYISRMKTLRRLSSEYPEYAAALAATSPEVFIESVSKRWSTDPNRAANVLEIYRAHGDILQAQSAPAA